MAQEPLPKPPITTQKLGRETYDWVNKLYRRLTEAEQLLWAQVDKAGSTLADLTTRAHSLLTDIGEVDPTDTDTTRNKHLSNNDAKGWTDHVAETSGVHGASGSILGTGNTSSTVTRGPQYKAAANTDASASTVSGSTSSVSVTSADATDLASVITLANEMKGDINTLVSNVNTLAGDVDSLVTDVNSMISSFNSLQSKLRTSEQLST